MYVQTSLSRFRHSELKQVRNSITISSFFQWENLILANQMSYYVKNYLFLTRTLTLSHLDCKFQSSKSKSFFVPDEEVRHFFFENLNSLLSGSYFIHYLLAPSILCQYNLLSRLSWKSSSQLRLRNLIMTKLHIISKLSIVAKTLHKSPRVTVGRLQFSFKSRCTDLVFDLHHRNQVRVDILLFRCHSTLDLISWHHVEFEI